MDATLDLQKAATQVVEKLDGWGFGAAKMLPNLVVAIIVLTFRASGLCGRTGGARAWFPHLPIWTLARLVAGMSRLMVMTSGLSWP